MAEKSRGWKIALAVAVLLWSTGLLLFAQSTPAPTDSNTSPGSLTGRLTDLYSKPLEGVTVILRAQASGAEVARTVTAKNGGYRFSKLAQGEYSLEAESTQLGRGQLESIYISAGREARVQAAINFEPSPAAPVLAAQPHQEPPRILALPKIYRPFIPLEATPLVAADLPSEPLQQLILIARAIPEPPNTSPPLSTPPPPSSPVSPVNPPLALLASTTAASELQSLPVSGRRWQDFILENAPTSSTPAGGQAETALRASGQQPVESAVDGISRSLAFGATNGSGQTSSGQAPLGQSGDSSISRSGPGGHGMAISESAIRTVETIAGNVEAASARAAGGRMNVETQSGTNDMHGQGFLFDRQNSWGAQNPFTQWLQQTSPANLNYDPSGPALYLPVFTPVAYTPPDHETTWGLGVGGRIRRNKLFWFAALDSYNRDDPSLSVVKHPYLVQTLSGCDVTPCPTSPTLTGFFAQPTNDQMQVLSARLGLSSVNPVVEGLKAYSCMLETFGGSSTDCPSNWPAASPLLGPVPRTAKQWTGFGRLDWQATERHRFTLEAIGAHWNSPGGGLTRVSETYGSHSFGTTKASEEWLLGRWEAYITPNLLAVTQASTGRVIEEARPETPSAFEQTFLAGNAYNQLPEIVVDNRFGFTIGNLSRFGSGSYPDERTTQGQESIDWIRGKLLVRSGFNLTHNADATTLLRNQTGTYTYSNVENFASDALAFEKYGLTNALNPDDQHNCDETGKVWRDSGGGLRGLGNLPCYSHYSQTIGPTDWHMTTNDWAIFSTTQWQPTKRIVFSAGLRWEREQRPPPLAALKNPLLPLTETMPALGNNFAPRLGLAVLTGKKRWPVFRFGYGIYYGRTTNRTLETALTQTGSFAGDLSFFMRPTDDLPNHGGGAPPFPYVLAGPPCDIQLPTPNCLIKPGAVEFAGIFRNPQIHQAIAAVEETLPGHIEVTASALFSLGRRLPISIDTNLNTPASTQTITYNVVDPAGAGPIKASHITVPFYASWPSSQGLCPDYTPAASILPGRPCPDYQQISKIEGRANSTYEAGMLRVTSYGRHGLSLHAHYVYGHAMDWNPNESSQAAGNDVLDPSNFGLEYGVSNQDIRHSFGTTVIYAPPWKLTGRAGKFTNHWMISGILQARSGLPYTMRTSGSLPKFFTTSGTAIVGLGPGMNGSGGDNRVYGQGSDGHFYNIGRNTYRYPGTWKADLRLGKRFDLGKMRQLELLAESFNLLNHQNVTQLETTGYSIQPGDSSGSLPTLNFMDGPVTETNGKILNRYATAFGQPLDVNATNFYRERQFQFGLRMRF
jgi:hypothetical protein